eukprot:9327281-Lingulodinium_polyedra.AAC.1
MARGCCARALRARVPHSAALRWQNARPTTSLRNVRQMLRNDVAERAARRFNAAKCATHAQTTHAP